MQNPTKKFLEVPPSEVHEEGKSCHHNHRVEYNAELDDSNFGYYSSIVE